MQGMACLVSHTFFLGKGNRLPAATGSLTDHAKEEPKLCATDPTNPAAWYKVDSYIAQGRGILVFVVPFNRWGFNQGVYVITLDNQHLQTVSLQ